MAAEHGQPETLKWCIEKWKEQGKQKELDSALRQEDYQGMTPLVSACFKGHLITRSNSADVEKSELEKTKVKQLRRRCVEMLIEEGS